MTTIVVVVKGGNVQDIYTNAEEGFNVVMLDYDNFESGDELDPNQLLMEEMIKNKQLNHIY